MAQLKLMKEKIKKAIPSKMKMNVLYRERDTV
jgi:hypothetical protein